MIESKKSESLNQVDQLKLKVFGKSPKEQDKIFRICEIINYLGGYNHFVETPIPIILEVNKLLDKMAEEQSKYPKIPKLRKK